MSDLFVDKPIEIDLDLDSEVRELVEAINRFEGVRTTESCCGHGTEPFRIWFMVRDLVDLPPLLFWLDGCHTGVYGWQVIVYTDCSMAPARFMIESTSMGDEAYVEAEQITECMNEFLDKETDIEVCVDLDKEEEVPDLEDENGVFGFCEHGIDWHESCDKCERRLDDKEWNEKK
jgi:hypothetical protein